MLIDRSFAELLGDASSDPFERREEHRMPIEIDVTIGGCGLLMSGVSINLSLGGIFVAAFAPMPVGARLSLELLLPTGTVAASGIVRWVREACPEHSGGMGIEFVEMGKLDRAALERVCGERARILSLQ
jgi:uncharacterized protein (TIGR02266 family)